MATFKVYADVATNRDPANAVYVIDEASLISDDYSESDFFRSGSGYLLRDLLNFAGFNASQNDRKIIFIGDPVQIPPVGMSTSPALDAKYLKEQFGIDAHEYRLTEVVRQKADSGKEAFRSKRKDHVSFVLPQLEKVSERFPDNAHLKRYQAELLHVVGRSDEALEKALAFVRSMSREYWAWEVLGDLVSEFDVKRGCYAKALLTSSNEEFIGNLRLKFAECIWREDPGRARGEVEQVIRCKQQQGYKIPKKAEELSNRSWFAEAKPVEPSASFYEKFVAPADSYLTAQIPVQLAVVDWINDDKKFFHFIVNKSLDGICLFSKYDGKPRVGDIVAVRVESLIVEGRKKTNVVTIQPSCDSAPSHLLKQFRGRVRVSNSMGFMEDGTFISPTIISGENILDGQEVSGRAVLSYDRKKARWSFAAIEAKGVI